MTFIFVSIIFLRQNFFCGLLKQCAHDISQQDPKKEIMHMIHI